MTTGELFASDALLPDGWARDVLLRWDAAGTLCSIEADAQADAAVPRAPGPLLPGMPNLHSHAFQRAFAGLTEFRGNPQDSFWSWRAEMYRFALRISPEALQAIATQLYIDMLKAGYTSVCEFHYVHHDTDGKPYADAAELSLRLLAAAQAAGIGITLLPVLYQTAGFGGTPPLAHQRRFIHSTDRMVALLERLQPECTVPGRKLGLAPHSLRAVPPDSLRLAVEALHALDAAAPVHIHIAEQVQEVQDCMQWSGQRPVAWLLDHVALDKRWCLVHATHLDDDELARTAASGAIVGICPTTEANLGDGIFPTERYLAAGGAWGIGSDSHISVSVSEELRWLEYAQRLTTLRRNVLASERAPQVATRLYQAAVSGGAQASARAVAGLATGQQADFMILDASNADVAGLAPDAALSAHVFSHRGTAAIAEVWQGGKRMVQHGRHVLDATAARDYIAARASLLNEA
ncbi:formimidoylglutamate deiminase [Imbroritus primus]|uniref:formimidoylglutamate deiminase n=1 Tax=Imbroritus primus TaxID=3058603 RepID=UPI003D1606E2